MATKSCLRPSTKAMLLAFSRRRACLLTDDSLRRVERSEMADGRRVFRALVPRNLRAKAVTGYSVACH